MSTYQHILIAVDLDEANEAVIKRALEISANGTQLSLIHVVEPVQAYGPIPAVDYSNIHQHAVSYAQNALAELGQRFGILSADLYVSEGVAQKEIHAFAEQQGVDLIVVGSHGRHGVSLLLGSTANAVLHGAKCDVLAVRV